MHAICRTRWWIFACSIFLALLGGRATAETRRALIVGINQYQIHPTGDRVPNLDGALADADAIAALLQSLHGFKPENIRILRDQEATRAALLSALDSHLVRSAEPGDLSLFYYAGHGSYVDNPTSQETDKRDETIIPADSNTGTPDIRDKELAQHFHRILDKKAQLIAIFDSCHSGSIARGLPDPIKNRFAPPAKALTRGHTAEKLPAQSVEERGALVWSAAQEHQPAQEKRIRGQPRGRFSSALEHVLSSPYREESVEKLHLRVRAIMQASGSTQEPVLGATAERRARGLWGLPIPSGVRGEAPTVAVSRVSASRIYVQAGIATGIGENAILRKRGEASGVRLRVVEVSGMASSVAEIMAGSPSSIATGDLFEVEEYGKPAGDGLHLYLPTQLPAKAELAVALKSWIPLLTEPRIRFVQDPTEGNPTHVIEWEKGRWQLREPSGRLVDLGIVPNVKLARKLLLAVPKSQTFLNVPVSKERAEQLREYFRSNRSFVEFDSDPASASYHVVGRVVAGSKTLQVEHALILPSTQSTDAHSALPARSNWIPDEEDRFLGSFVSEGRRLNKVLLWRSIDSPPPDGTFPYQLAVIDLGANRVVAAGEPLRSGRQYQLAMVASAIGPKVRPRYVYVFSLDREGSCSLHLPLSDSSNIENYIPDVRPGSGAPQAQILIGHGFSVSPPFGRDTMIAVTTVTPIASPSAFCADNERRSLGSSSADPLTQFLFGINQDTRASSSISTSWSLQRLTVDSVDK